LEGDSVDLVIYDGSFAVRNSIKLTEDAAPGKRELRGTLRYQACDDRHCLFPTTLPFTVRLRVGQPPRLPLLERSYPPAGSALIEQRVGAREQLLG